MKHLIPVFASATALVSAAVLAPTFLDQPAQASTKAAPAALTGMHVESSASTNYLCLTVAEGNPTHGAQVDLETCHPGWTPQQWNFSGGHMASVVGSNLCLNDRWNNPANGAAIDVYDCNPSWPAQTWTYTGSQELRNANNLCLEVTDWNYYQGASVTLYTCTGANNQKWYFYP